MYMQKNNNYICNIYFKYKKKNTQCINYYLLLSNFRK